MRHLRLRRGRSCADLELCRHAGVAGIVLPKAERPEDPGLLGVIDARHQVEVFDMPFIFDDYEGLSKVIDGPVGTEMLERLDAKGFIGLGYWDNGFKSMTANKPLRNPADIKGLKMRIQSSKVLDAEMRAVGALPQVLAFSEVYQAMQTGVVDGNEITISNIYTKKTNEVQKCLTLTEHGYIGYAVIVKKAFWSGLPADIRATLETAMKETSQYVRGIAKQENDAALESIRQTGKTQIITITPEEKKAWKKALLPVHKEMENRVGKDVIQAIHQSTGFDPKKL